MKRSLFLWQAAGFAFATLGGTLLHFLYDWTGANILIAPFSGINESTWEHMKLLFWPLLLFALLQQPFFRQRTDYWCVKLAGTLLGLLLIPVLFYSYNGALGKSPDWVNIAIFYLAAAATFFLEWWLFRHNFLLCGHPQLALAALCLTGVLFVVFTFRPPQIPLFRDPVSGIYGIPETGSLYVQK